MDSEDTVQTVQLHTVCLYTVKSVYNSGSKIDKTKILMTNGCLMKVESIAECSL